MYRGVGVTRDQAFPPGESVSPMRGRWFGLCTIERFPGEVGMHAGIPADSPLQTLEVDWSISLRCSIFKWHFLACPWRAWIEDLCFIHQAQIRGVDGLGSPLPTQNGFMTILCQQSYALRLIIIEASHRHTPCMSLAICPRDGSRNFVKGGGGYPHTNAEGAQQKMTTIFVPTVRRKWKSECQISVFLKSGTKIQGLI